MLLAGVDEAQQPELDRACAAAGACPLGEVGYGFMQENGDGLLGRIASKGLVDGIAPELHAHEAYRGVRDGLGESGELEVEGSQGVVGILGGSRDELAQEV